MQTLLFSKNTAAGLAFALLVAMASIASGCGSNAASPQPRTTRAAGPVSSKVATSTPKTGRALLKAALFRQSDMSSDWIRLPPIRTNQKCTSNTFRVARASATKRFNASTSEMQQRAVLFGSAREATAAYRHFRRREEVSCFRQAIASALRAYSGSDLLGPLTNIRREDLGPTERAIRMRASVNYAGRVTTIYIDNIHKQAGRGFSTLAIISALTPIDDAFYDQALEVFSKRIVKMGTAANRG